MRFSPSKYMEWLQFRAKTEGEREYNFLMKLKELIKGNYHKGAKDAFFEAQQMCAGDGPIYVCNSDKNPWPKLAKCKYASMIKPKFIIHLKEEHDLEYKDSNDIDTLHKFKMKDA